MMDRVLFLARQRGQKLPTPKMSIQMINLTTLSMRQIKSALLLADKMHANS